MDCLNGITKETFCKSPNEVKLDLLFDCLVAVNQNLNKSQKYDKIAAVVGGFVGAVAVLTGKGLLWGRW